MNQHRFQINLRGIIDLLSNHLYSGPQVYLRELLQNGVDAIRARETIEPGHVGELHIEITPPGHGPRPTLAFIDNGIGLNEDEIHQFLATIGESSKRDALGERTGEYLGQFGIGLLSTFVVCDEIVVITRSARDREHPAIEWRGRPDGTYSVKLLKGDFAAGTRVYLTGKPGMEEYFEPARVEALAQQFGGLLPDPIRVTTGPDSHVINAEPPPWRREDLDDDARTKALLDFGRATFDLTFLDAIPLRSTAGGVEGVALVLPFVPNLAARPTHRVYLKGMLLSEDAEGLLPDWAFFVKCVVNANDLRPMASREAFYEDQTLLDARDALGEVLRSYLLGLAQNDPKRLQRLIDLHALSIKALAIQDDDSCRIFADWLPFETSMGTMTLGEYRSRYPVVRYVADLDQFRQISQVAKEQGVCVLNAGYTYNQELLSRLPQVFPDAVVEAVDPSGLAQNFDDLTEDEQEQTAGFLRTADEVLRPFHCVAVLKRFWPLEVPALYTTDPEGQFLRAIEQSREVVNPFWSSMLDGLAERNKPIPPAQLCFNYRNPMVALIAHATHEENLLQRNAIQMLYVQALLLGHHPFQAGELNLLNQSMMGLIAFGLKPIPKPRRKGRRGGEAG